MTEKPLHVQVAQALGWTCIEYAPPNLWTGCRPSSRPHSPCPSSNVLSGEVVPTYDTDWSATGPLIEKYGISLECSETPLWGAFASPGFPILGGKPTDSRIYRVDTTPLGAVCHLFLALKAAGKL